MHEGQPRTYWRMRRIASVIQILILAAAFTLVGLWLARDGNAQRLLDTYLRLSVSFHDSVVDRTRYPWEPGGRP